MCGISGVFSSRPLETLRDDVHQMVEGQHSRGPDFHAVETIRGCRGGVVLGHNRLSIIDLSPNGNQPMWDAERRLCIVYNGEVYNHVELRAELAGLGRRFLSTSDTEVILEAFREWGTDAFGRFNGMFAFGLWDARNEELYLVRDRFGVKPLYYHLSGDTLHLASTAVCLARVLGLEPDLEYAARGLQYMLYEQRNAAPFMGMKAIPPGYWMRVSADGSGSLAPTLQPYYDLEGRTAVLVDSLSAMPVKQTVDACAQLLEDSVGIRLRSDVPVAVSLSGGLDSSSVAAMAAFRCANKLQGFTFGHPRAPTSEGPLAAELAKISNIDVTYVWPSVSEVCAAYEKTLHAQDGPFTGGSIVAQYLVFEAARNGGFKVLLGGQGGDEAFMGYRKFQLFHFRRLAAQKRYLDALGFALTLLPTFLAERHRWLSSWSTRSRYGKRSGMGTLLHLPRSEMAIGYRPTEPLRHRQLLDVTSLSLPTLLRYEDGNSMGNSIESRLPFLDYRLMEFGLALPEALKLRGGYGKWIVRRVMTGRIPETIRAARYKRGFDVQQQRWIDDGLGRHIRGLLDERSDCVKEWLPSGAQAHTAFSNEALKRRPSAYGEATTLLWLACATSARTVSNSHRGAAW